LQIVRVDCLRCEKKFHDLLVLVQPFRKGKAFFQLDILLLFHCIVLKQLLSLIAVLHFVIVCHGLLRDILQLRLILLILHLILWHKVLLLLLQLVLNRILLLILDILVVLYLRRVKLINILILGCFIITIFNVLTSLLKGLFIFKSQCILETSPFKMIFKMLLKFFIVIYFNSFFKNLVIFRLVIELKLEFLFFTKSNVS